MYQPSEYKPVQVLFSHASILIRRDGAKIQFKANEYEQTLYSLQLFNIGNIFKAHMYVITIAENEFAL